MFRPKKDRKLGPVACLCICDGLILMVVTGRELCVQEQSRGSGRGERERAGHRTTKKSDREREREEIEEGTERESGRETEREKEAADKQRGRSNLKSVAG